MDFLVKNWALAAVALVSGSMLIWSLIQGRFSNLKAIGPAQVTRLINSQDAVLLDVRETNEYEGGCLPSAVHIPLSQLPSRVGELARHAARPVVVYCDRGNRSRMCSKALAAAGFKELYQLAGGIRAWKDAGLPVEK